MFKAISSEAKLQGEHYESIMRYLRSNVPKNIHRHQYLGAAMLYPPLAPQYYAKSMFSNNYYFYWDQQEMPPLEQLGHRSIIYFDNETHHQTIVFGYQTRDGKNTTTKNGTVVDDSDNPKVWMQTDYLVMMRMRAIWKAMDRRITFLNKNHSAYPDRSVMVTDPYAPDEYYVMHKYGAYMDRKKKPIARLIRYMVDNRMFEHQYRSVGSDFRSSMQSFGRRSMGGKQFSFKSVIDSLTHAEAIDRIGKMQMMPFPASIALRHEPGPTDPMHLRHLEELERYSSSYFAHAMEQAVDVNAVSFEEAFKPFEKRPKVHLPTIENWLNEISPPEDKKE